MFRVTLGTKDTVGHLGIDVEHENSQHRNDPFSDMISTYKTGTWDTRLRGLNFMVFVDNNV